MARRRSRASAQDGIGGSILEEFATTIAVVAALSIGLTLAERAVKMTDRAVDAVLGSRTTQRNKTAPSEAAATKNTTLGGSDSACNIHSKAFQDCLNTNGNDISKCQFYMDMLNECRSNSGSTLNA